MRSCATCNMRKGVLCTTRARGRHCRGKQAAPASATRTHRSQPAKPWPHCTHTRAESWRVLALVTSYRVRRPTAGGGNVIPRFRLDSPGLGTWSGSMDVRRPEISRVYQRPRISRVYLAMPHISHVYRNIIPKQEWVNHATISLMSALRRIYGRALLRRRSDEEGQAGGQIRPERLGVQGVT